MNVLNATMFPTVSKALVFGEVLFDRISNYSAAADESPAVVLGGAPANFAFRLVSQQLLMGNQNYSVQLASAVGQDLLGDRAIEALRGKNLDLSLLQRLPGKRTGIVDVTKFDDNSVKYIIHPDVAYDHIVPQADLLNYAKDVKLLYFGSLIRRDAHAESRATLGQIVNSVSAEAIRFVDLNLRNDCYDAASLKWCVHNSTIVKLNDDEYKEVDRALGFRSSDVRQFALNLTEELGKTVIVTCGARGAMVSHISNNKLQFDYDPGYGINKSEIVDVVGCGDSFAAEFVRCLGAGKEIPESLKAANLVGAAVALTQGGMSHLALDKVSKIASLPRQFYPGMERGLPY